MRSELSGTELIERYLVARGRRYFRGHHDGEYFFILSVDCERLHVHLEISPADRDVLTIRVTPACFFPAADRGRLRRCADEWNRQDRHATATVYESCDQTRIGVAAQFSCSLAADVSFDEFAGLTDDAMTSAVDFFAQLTPATGAKPGRGLGTWLKDAG